MYDVICVKIAKAFCYIQHLGRITSSIKCDYKERLTRQIRLASGFVSMNSTRVLFDIHSEIICKGLVVMPMKGTMFGCLNLFHIMASSKKDYRVHKRSLVDVIKTCYTEHEPS